MLSTPQGAAAEARGSAMYVTLACLALEAKINKYTMIKNPKQKLDTTSPANIN